MDFNNPWRDSLFPPNGYGCQCCVRWRTKGDLKRMDKDGPDTAPIINRVDRVVGENSSNPRIVRMPDGIDQSFEHIPGQSRLETFIPSPLDENLITSAGSPNIPNQRALNPLPAPRTANADCLTTDKLTDEDYVDFF